MYMKNITLFVKVTSETAKTVLQRLTVAIAGPGPASGSGRCAGMSLPAR
jgi:hypothetical protein